MVKMKQKLKILESDFHPNLDMVFVEGGTFLMGSEDNEALDREKPVHEVKLSSFYIARVPVTQALWKAVMGEDNNPSYFKGDRRPVETVSWEEAKKFINELNERKNRNYRLPTEAEWEYAARGGKYSKNYKYSGSNQLKEVGWYRDNSHRETKEVGLKLPNELGLYDMSGNVYEWCLDRYSGSYYQDCLQGGVADNPSGPVEGSRRVFRGGGWFSAPRLCRSTFRDYGVPGFRYDYIGFRLVLPQVVVS